MAYSFSENTGDGTTTTFPFTFVGPDNGYFNEDDIFVEVDGVDTPFTLTGPTQVTISPAPVAGAKIRTIRKPDDTAPYTDFQRGNSFGKTNINRSFQQQLYLLHRIIDGFKEDGYYEKQNLSMGTNYKITDLAVGEDDTDAATVGQLNQSNVTDLYHRNWITI